MTHPPKLGIFARRASAAMLRHSSLRRRRAGDYTVTRRLFWIAAIAAPIGVLSAVVSWLLQRLIGFITHLVFYQEISTDLVSPGTGHPWYIVLFAPVLGGLIIGLMARYGTEKIRGHGMPETMESILIRGSVVHPKVAFFKPISAAISIGTGGPFGAEGPIIMTGGALGSTVAQALRLTANERKTLLVAGGAAGMAATFNSPLGAIILAVELLLFEWKPRSFIPVSVAVATATLVREPLLGSEAMLLMEIPTDIHVDWWVHLLAIVIGASGALLAVLSTELIYRAEDAFHKLPFHWMWWPPIGGLIIGVGGLIQPRAMGVGYDVLGELLHGVGTWSFLISLLIVKLLIWGLALGSGTSGSVLAPTFLLGATMGAAIGLPLPDVFPGFWALLGLAAVVGGVLRAPLTGIVFTMELTHSWPFMLPLIVASVSAYAFSVFVMRRSILTEMLARRGLHLTLEYTVDPMESATVAQVMTRVDRISPPHGAHRLACVSPEATLNQLMSIFLDSGTEHAYVLDRTRNKVIGTITLAEVLKIRRNALRADRIRVRNLSPRRLAQIVRSVQIDKDEAIDNPDAFGNPKPPSDGIRFIR